MWMMKKGTPARPWREVRLALLAWSRRATAKIPDRALSKVAVLSRQNDGSIHPEDRDCQRHWCRKERSFSIRPRIQFCLAHPSCGFAKRSRRRKRKQTKSGKEEG